MNSLIALSSQPERNCGEAATIATQHLADVEERLHQLTALRDELAEMSASGCCAERMADCKILQALAKPQPTVREEKL